MDKETIDAHNAMAANEEGRRHRDRIKEERGDKRIDRLEKKVDDLTSLVTSLLKRLDATGQPKTGK